MKYKYLQIISLWLVSLCWVVAEKPEKKEQQESLEDWLARHSKIEDIKPDKRRIKGPPLVDKNGKPLKAKISKKQLLAEGKIVPLDKIIGNKEIDHATMRRSMFVFLLNKLKVESLEASLKGIPINNKGLIYNKFYHFSYHHDALADDKASEYKLFWTKVAKCLLIQDYLMHHQDDYWKAKAFDGMFTFLLQSTTGLVTDIQDYNYQFKINELRVIVYCACELYYDSKMELVEHPGSGHENQARKMIISSYNEMNISREYRLKHYIYLYENTNVAHQNHWAIIIAKYYLSRGDKKMHVNGSRTISTRTMSSKNAGLRKN